MSSHHLLATDTKQHSKKSCLLISVVTIVDSHSGDSLTNFSCISSFCGFEKIFNSSCFRTKLCPLAHSKAHLLTLGCGEGKCSVYRRAKQGVWDS